MDNDNSGFIHEGFTLHYTNDTNKAKEDPNNIQRRQMFFEPENADDGQRRGHKRAGCD